MSSRSSTNLAQEGKSTSKSSKDKKLQDTNPNVKEFGAATTKSAQVLDDQSPRLRRTSSGPSKRLPRTPKDPVVPWTSLAVQTAAGVITLLCRAQGLDSVAASTTTSTTERDARERPGVVVTLREDSCESVSSRPSEQRDSSGFAQSLT